MKEWTPTQHSACSSGLYFSSADNSELERQKTIAENRLLLDSLGLDPSGASKIPGASTPKLAKPKASSVKKRKAPVVHDEGPRRRSGRLAGIEATPEEVAKREEAEEQQREELRIVNRRVRDQVMSVEDMVDEDSPSSKEELVRVHVGLSLTDRTDS